MGIMNITLKTNQEKVEALFATRKKEMEAELARMDVVKELVLDAMCHEDSNPMSMDALYNEAFASYGNQAYGTDAQMVLDHITRNI